jgi:hypothetical protein
MSSFFGEKRDFGMKSHVKRQFRVEQQNHFGFLLILEGAVREGKTKWTNQEGI